MKKVLSVLLAAALSAIAFAQTPAPAKEPKKNVISSFRVMPKVGHTDAFKAAIAAHAQKYHKGDTAWRVGEVISGADGGMFQINEGPSSWTALDGRGDLGAEHQADFDKNIMPHIEKITPDSYATFSEDLSCVKMEAWSNKILMYHYLVKPGKSAAASDVLKRSRALWEKRGLNVAVWVSAFSGQAQYSVAFRLKNGWKDFDADGMSNREAATALWGAASFERLNADIADCFEKVTSELVNYDPALGSK